MNTQLAHPGQKSDTTAGASRLRRRRFKKRWIIVALMLAALVYAAVDLYGPRKSNLRDFDPNEVARLETAMWRSYYDRQRVRLFNQLAEMLRTQYRLPFIRSNAVAYQAAKAAFVFKDGRGREDYEKALPNLVSFYAEIHKVSDVDFDVNRAARLELEWWIVHRERKRHKAGDLENALAELVGEIYQMPPEKFMEHARLRAEAMTIRDTKAEDGDVTEENWGRIGELLRESWQSLWQAVNS
ncbi:MAG TPA: hypothetical protein VNO70_08235 [Blastocatellia bacterium]|nr:hypothetical protein [Blastocatellia bacterium]